MRHSCHIFAAKGFGLQEQSHRILDYISGSIILSVFYVWTLRVNFFSLQYLRCLKIFLKTAPMKKLTTVPADFAESRQCSHKSVFENR